MKLYVFVLSILSLIMLNGCLIYQNTISWEQQPNKTNENSDLKAQFELSQSQRFLTFPFLFINYSKKKELYAPILHLTTIDSAKSLIEFRFVIDDTNGNRVFSDSIDYTIVLNKVLDYKALSFDFKREYSIKGLTEREIGDTMKIDFELTLLYSNGSKEKFYFKQKKLVKTRMKKLSSYF